MQFYKLCNQDQENKIELSVLSRLDGSNRRSPEDELMPHCGKLLLEGYYDAVTVCTKGPPMPEIDDFHLLVNSSGLWI
jgi:hypothetical protein